MITSDYVLAAENAYRRDQVRATFRDRATRRALARRRARRASVAASTARTLRTA